MTSGEVKAGPTPGPWYVCEEDLTIRSRNILASAQMGDYRGTIIADLKPALGASDGGDLSIARPHARPETEANARLIAAAPQLLKILIACSERLHSYADHCDSVTDGNLYDMACSVIRKAQGGTR